VFFEHVCMHICAHRTILSNRAIYRAKARGLMCRYAPWHAGVITGHKPRTRRGAATEAPDTAPQHAPHVRELAASTIRCWRRSTAAETAAPVGVEQRSDRRRHRFRTSVVPVVKGTSPSLRARLTSRWPYACYDERNPALGGARV
jgi:hypothetical protein